jgi:hypothetical protein
VEGALEDPARFRADLIRLVLHLGSRDSDPAGSTRLSP